MTEARLTVLEVALLELHQELRTKRLVICDPDGQERIIAEVHHGQAELRLGPPQQVRGFRSAVVLFAHGGDHTQEPGLGLQLWGDGNSIAALDAWKPDGRSWQATCHVEDPD